MGKFLTELKAPLKDGSDEIYVLESPLKYASDLVGVITVPAGFETDLASVPRLPVLYTLWGGRAHREAVLHDYLYRTDAFPSVEFDQANRVFFEAMTVRDKSWWVRYPMYWGVCLGGRTSYHKRKVGDKL